MPYLLWICFFLRWRQRFYKRLKEKWHIWIYQIGWLDIGRRRPGGRPDDGLEAAIAAAAADCAFGDWQPYANVFFSRIGFKIWHFSVPRIYPRALFFFLNKNSCVDKLKSTFFFLNKNSCVDKLDSTWDFKRLHTSTYLRWSSVATLPKFLYR